MAKLVYESRLLPYDIEKTREAMGVGSRHRHTNGRSRTTISLSLNSGTSLIGSLDTDLGPIRHIAGTDPDEEPHDYQKSVAIGRTLFPGVEAVKFTV